MQPYLGGGYRTSVEVAKACQNWAKEVKIACAAARQIDVDKDRVGSQLGAKTQAGLALCG